MTGIQMNDCVKTYTYCNERQKVKMNLRFSATFSKMESIVMVMV